MHPIAAQSVVIEFEKVLVDCLEARLIPLKYNKRNEYLLDKNNDILIICGLTIYKIVEAIHFFGKNIDKFDKVVVYVFDAFIVTKNGRFSRWKSKFSRMYRALKKIDYIFVPFMESINDFQDNLSIKAFYLPMARHF